MMILGIRYEVTSVSYDSQEYGRPTAFLQRADGYTGNLTISGIGADELKVGKTYMIGEVEPNTNGV